MGIKIESVTMNKPEDANIIIGHSHFIKTVEDLYEVLVGTVPSIKFGLAFCEASRECLIRVEGNDEALKGLAVENASRIGCGHLFLIVMSEAYPINVLNQIKNVPEVCRIFCATANPVEVLIASSQQGRGVIGVIDGFPPRGVETEEDMARRKELLRKIGYKR